MAAPWSEVASSPAFKALPPDQQEAARGQYFNDVVAPQVPPEKLQDVRAQFDSSTRSAPVVMQNLPTMADSMKAEMADRPVWEKALGGVGTAVDNAAMRLKQLTGRTLTPQDTANVQANRQMTNASDTAAAGNFAGNMAMTAVPGAALYSGGAALGRAALPAALQTLAPTVGGAISGGITAGLTEPVLKGESAGANIGLGAAGGAAGDLAARGIARAVQPIMQSPAVQTLLQNGIVPTPGQATGANSVWGRVEQKLQSVPLIGDVITGARNRATGEFNQAAINRAIPVGQAASQAATPGIGRDAIHRTDQILSQGYDDVLNRIGSVRVSPNFLGRAQAAVADPDLALPGPVQQRLINIVQEQILNRTPANNTMTAQLAKRADANLGMLAREYSSSSDADQRMLARGIRAVQQAWRDNITAGAPPDVAADLQEMNRAFANFVRVERAAGMSGARDGVFSPVQLQSAVRAMDSSSRRGNFSQGRALMQDLTDPAVATLSQTVPNSGTLDRAMIGGLLGLGGAGANEYFGGPSYLTAAALAPLAYSRTGARYAVGDLFRNAQPAAANAARASAPYAAVAGGNLADLLRQRQPEPRAGGGPVTAGKPYLVGEIQPERYVDDQGRRQMVGVNGPQVFVPQQNGTVLPNRGVGLAGLLEQLRAQGPAWAKTENAMDSAQVQRTLRRQ